MQVAYDNALIAVKLRRWEKYLNEYKLPVWESIPNFGLYMEQVIVLLKEYLDYLPPELKEEQFITAATINNYVRRELMPEPVKKKYYRIHIAYLIMICSLKQSLSISTLQAMIPMGIPEEEVRETYNAYVKQHQITAKYFIEQVRLVAAGILNHEPEVEIATGKTCELITTAAVVSGLARLLAEKLLLLNDRTLEDGGNIEIK